MPANVVRGARDERHWQMAKDAAKKQGRTKDYAYIMGIYQKMNKADPAVEEREEGEAPPIPLTLPNTAPAQPVVAPPPARKAYAYASDEDDFPDLDEGPDRVVKAEATVGEIREWSGVKMQKKGPGDWQPVGGGKQPKMAAGEGKEGYQQRLKGQGFTTGEGGISSKLPPKAGQPYKPVKRSAAGEAEMEGKAKQFEADTAASQAKLGTGGQATPTVPMDQPAGEGSSAHHKQEQHKQMGAAMRHAAAAMSAREQEGVGDHAQNVQEARDAAAAAAGQQAPAEPAPGQEPEAGAPEQGAEPQLPEGASLQEKIQALMVSHGAEAVQQAVQTAGMGAAQAVDQQLQAAAGEVAQQPEVVKAAQGAVASVMGGRPQGQPLTQADAQEAVQAVMRDRAVRKVAEAKLQEMAGPLTEAVAGSVAAAVPPGEAEKAGGMSKLKATLWAGIKLMTKPFVFGFVDNFMLYVAGAGVDNQIQGAGFGAETTAGIGNAISDAVGTIIAAPLEKMVAKLGPPEEELKAALGEKTWDRMQKVLEPIGVFAGCIAGMVPLLFGVKFGKSWTQEDTMIDKLARDVKDNRLTLVKAMDQLESKADQTVFLRELHELKKATPIPIPVTKGGEGSRGGNIIGHTVGGKAIYESHANDTVGMQHLAREHKMRSDHWKGRAAEAKKKTGKADRDYEYAAQAHDTASKVFTEAVASHATKDAPERQRPVSGMSHSQLVHHAHNLSEGALHADDRAEERQPMKPAKQGSGWGSYETAEGVAGKYTYPPSPAEKRKAMDKAFPKGKSAYPDKALPPPDLKKPPVVDAAAEGKPPQPGQPQPGQQPPAKGQPPMGTPAAAGPPQSGQPPQPQAKAQPMPEEEDEGMGEDNGPGSTGHHADQALAHLAAATAHGKAHQSAKQAEGAGGHQQLVNEATEATTQAAQPALQQQAVAQQPVPGKKPPGPPQPQPPQMMNKGLMGIDLSAEDALVKALEDGMELGGQAAGLYDHQGRSRLRQLRKGGGDQEPLTKGDLHSHMGMAPGEDMSGGVVHRGEAISDRPGDSRETFMRQRELDLMREDDPAGNRGNGGLDSWFSDAYGGEPEVRVPVNMGVGSSLIHKAAEPATRIVEDYGAGGIPRSVNPSDGQAGRRLLNQGGGRENKKY